MSKIVSLSEAQLALANSGVVLKDSKVIQSAAVTGDVEELTRNIDVESTNTFDMEAGMQGLVAAVDFAERRSMAPTAVVLPEGVRLISGDLETAGADTVVLDREYFSPENPKVLKSFSMALASSTVNGDAGLEQMYPTVNVPANVEGILLTLPFGSIRSKFLRDDPSITGAEKLAKQSVYNGLRNPNVVKSGANALIPVSNAKNDVYLDNDFNIVDYVHPTTGEKITTAPILFDTKFDLVSIAHTTQLLSDGVFDNDTNLDIGGKILAVYGKIEADKFMFDISTLPMNEISAVGVGDQRDIGIGINTQSFVIDPALIRMIDGTVSPELDKIAAGLKLVYSLDITGQGNLVTCDWGVSKPIYKLLKVVDVDGNTVDTSVALSDGETAAAVGNALVLTSYTLDQTVTNTDLKIIANVIDVEEIGQKIHVHFNAMDVYERTILSDNNPVMAQNILATAITRGIIRKTDIQARALRASVRNAATDVNGGTTNSLVSAVVTPYNVTEPLNLATLLDSKEHSTRKEDIAALIEGKIKSKLSAMFYDTNYSALVAAYGRDKIGVGITYGTNLIPFIPTEEIAVDGMEIRKALTIVKDFENDIFVYPIDLSHNSVTPAPLNFGMRVAKADLVVTGIYDKTQGTYVIPRQRAVTMVEILQTFNVSGMTEALEKIAANSHAV